MQLFYIAEVKRFMNSLLKTGMFDGYEARGVVLQSVTRFEISCEALEQNEAVNTEQSAERDSAQNTSGKTKYCSWSEIKPFVVDLIKGASTPRLLKIVLSLSGAAAEKLIANASSLHITITYDGGTVSVLTGASQIKFTLDKAVDNEWDAAVRRLMAQNGFKTLETADELNIIAASQ